MREKYKVGSSTSLLGTPLGRSFFFLNCGLLICQIHPNLIVALSVPLVATRITQDRDSVLRAEKQ